MAKSAPSIISGPTYRNKGVAASGYLKFCQEFGRGDSLVKSASYLLHNPGFSDVRDFLLKNSAAILQDDTGIPVKFLTIPTGDSALTEPTCTQSANSGTRISPSYGSFTGKNTQRRLTSRLAITGASRRTC